MSSNLRINATNARKNFYDLVNRIADGELDQVVVTKKGLKNDVVITKSAGKFEEVFENQAELLDSAYGSLKHGKIKPNENELAKEVFIKKYKKKHNIK